MTALSASAVGCFAPKVVHAGATLGYPKAAIRFVRKTQVLTAIRGVVTEGALT